MLVQGATRLASLVVQPNACNISPFRPINIMPLCIFDLSSVVLMEASYIASSLIPRPLYGRYAIVHGHVLILLGVRFRDFGWCKWLFAYSLGVCATWNNIAGLVSRPTYSSFPMTDRYTVRSSSVAGRSFFLDAPTAKGFTRSSLPLLSIVVFVAASCIKRAPIMLNDFASVKPM